MLKRVVYLILLLAAVRLDAQTYSPVAVTGYNIDAVAETAPSSLATTSQSIDGSNHVMYSANFAAGAGFPGGVLNSGTIVSGTRTYQLAPYTGNNTLFVPTGSSGAFTLTTPASYSSISLLLFSTENASNITVSMTYTDGTTTNFGSFNVQDWFFGSGAVYCCFGRCTRLATGVTFDGYPNDPRFYPLDLQLGCADMKKAVQSINITTNSGTEGVFVMAASGALYTQTITPTYTDVACFGTSTGSASVAVSGSTSPYTYSWNSTPVQTSANAANLPAGNYTVTVTDSKGCTSTASVAISQPVQLTTTATAVNSVCGPANGSITMAAAGGTTPYQYNINGGAYAAASSFTALGPGTYTTTVKDSKGCLASATSTIIITGAPVVSVNSGTICLGASMTLTASGASTYSWTPATALSSTSGANVTANPTVSTVYTVTGTDAAGCIGIASSTVTVSNNLVLVMSPASATICSGQSTTLSVSGAGSYTWSPSVTLNTANSATVTASPINTTTYTVTGDNSGCLGTNTVEVTVNPTPVVVITPAADTVCAGSSAALSASGAASYAWSPSGSLDTGTGATVNASPAATTIYTITGTSAQGCIGTGTVQVAVIAMPALAVSATPSTICEGSATLLQASGASGYTWSPAASVNSPNSNNTSATPTTSTTYTLTGSNGTSTHACLSTATLPVNVIPKINVTISGNDSICIGESALLTASGGNTYLWTPGVTTPNKPVTFATPSVTTTYSVTVSNNHICPITSTITVVVNPRPLVNGGADTTINIDESYVLHGTGSGEVGWTTFDGSALICNYCPVVEVSPKETTCYQLRSVNGHGCANADTVCIHVTKDWGLYIPNAFTPTGDGLNDEFLPQGYGLSGMDMSIYNRWGEKLFTSQDLTKGWDGKFGGKTCEPGVYVYRVVVTTMGGETATRTGEVTLLAKIR